MAVEVIRSDHLPAPNPASVFETSPPTYFITQLFLPIRSFHLPLLDPSECVHQLHCNYPQILFISYIPILRCLIQSLSSKGEQCSVLPKTLPKHPQPSTHLVEGKRPNPYLQLLHGSALSSLLWAVECLEGDGWLTVQNPRSKYQVYPFYGLLAFTLSGALWGQTKQIRVTSVLN